jgi:periplasmic divalent cation tolerance protein
MNRIALVRATFADRAEARRIATAMVEARLAACVTLTAAESVFAWDGKIAAEPEIVAVFKTRSQIAPLLAARVATLHSYELPAITWWTVAADERVIAWVIASTDA